MERKKLGLLLSTPPCNANITTVIRLSEEALGRNTDVYLYLIDEGVKNAADSRLLQLTQGGAKIFLCAYGCQQHAFPTEGLSKDLTLCGLVVLGNIINACDRFIAFN